MPVPPRGVRHGGAASPPAGGGQRGAPPSPSTSTHPPVLPTALLTPPQGLVVAEEADAGLLGAHGAAQSMAAAAPAGAATDGEGDRKSVV